MIADEPGGKGPEFWRGVQEAISRRRKGNQGENVRKHSERIAFCGIKVVKDYGKSDRGRGNGRKEVIAKTFSQGDLRIRGGRKFTRRRMRGCRQNQKNGRI